MVRVALDRSELSPRFTSNGIHMKSEADNFQGNGLGKGLGASQAPIQKRKPKTRVSQTLEHLLGDERKLDFSHELFQVSKSHHHFRVFITLLL